MKLIPLFFLMPAAFFATSIHATTITINSTNFSVTNISKPPSVSNTYTATGHVGLQYKGGTDFLNSDQHFTLTFNYTGEATPIGGAAFWFGTASSANWIFVNEEPYNNGDSFRNFSTRNLAAHSGGVIASSAKISDAAMVGSTTYTLSLDRVFSDGNYFLQNIEVRNPLNSVIGTLADVNVGTDANWGVSIYAPSSGTAMTTTISSLDVSPISIPEPSSYAILVSAFALMISLRRRHLRRG